MDLKGWATAVAQRSSQLAREGMHYVEKKIEQQQHQLQQQVSWGGALFRRGASVGGPPSEEGPPVAVPSAATYYIQPSDCRGFPPADACERLQQQQLLLHQLSSKSIAADSSSPNCFLLPPGVAPHEVTVGLFRTLFASAQSLPDGQGAPYHLRFRAPCPGAPSGFVWIDAPPEDEPVPTCSSGSSNSCCIVCKALLLPPALQPKAAAAAQAHAADAAAATVAVAAARIETHETSYATEESINSRRQQQQHQHGEQQCRHQHRHQQQQQQQHSDAGTDRSYESSTTGRREPRASTRVSGGSSPNLMSGGFLGEELGAGGPSTESLFDEGGPLGDPPPVLPRAQSDPDPHAHLGGLHRSQTAQEPLTAVEPVLRRAELAANREARKQQRMLEKLQEVEKRRAQETKQQQDKLALPEELKLELDRWAKTADGSFKDVRTLLSTMHEVLWQDAAWEPASLSSLMMSATLKKQFRRALLLAHPDKHQSAPPARQYRAERIFQALNESFKAVNP
ncbi:hypothetical protein Esti_006398 [Eimeria stiedai]